jgi:hypothetical protein
MMVSVLVRIQLFCSHELGRLDAKKALNRLLHHRTVNVKFRLLFQSPVRNLIEQTAIALLGVGLKFCDCITENFVPDI